MATKKKKPVSPEVEFVHALPDEFLACRKWGHAWEPAWHLYRGEGELEGCFFRIIHCGRCSMIRIDVYDLSGMFITRRYRTPDGYRAKGYRITGADIEAEVVSRSKIDVLANDQRFGVGARPRIMPVVK